MANAQAGRSMTARPDLNGLGAGERRVLRVSEIRESVCQRFGLSSNEMRSRDRTHRVARPRAIAMYLARRLTAKSYRQIGQAFGRDHSTVVYACCEMRRLRAVDRELNGVISALAASLSGSAQA
jgi:chromosomal replication initiator protein